MIVLVIDPTNTFLKAISAAEVPIVQNRSLSVATQEVDSITVVKCTLTSAGHSRNIVFRNMIVFRLKRSKFKTNDDVRTRTMKWLNKSYPRKNKVAGILYLHPIFRQEDPKHLRVLEEGFGDWKILLATTRWNLVDPAKGSRYEEELRTNDWKPMIERGSNMIRLEYTVASGLRTLHMLNDWLSKNVGIVAAIACDLSHSSTLIDYPSPPITT